MKLYNSYIWLFYIALIPLLNACTADEFSDWDQESPVVMWENNTYNADIIISPLEEKVDEVKIKLFGAPLNKDLNVQIEVDPATTAISGQEFSITETNLTLKAGESFVKVPFAIDKDKLEADKEKTVVLNIKTVGAGARKSPGQTTIKLNKLLYDASVWEGDYTFDANGGGWTRDATIKATGKPYELTMNNFWGNGLDMTGTIDATDLNNLRFIVPAGTKLDNGWDDRGAWKLKTDLIATLDEGGFVMSFIQFDYITEDGTEGSFPWCATSCEMIKK